MSIQYLAKVKRLGIKEAKLFDRSCFLRVNNKFTMRSKSTTYHRKVASRITIILYMAERWEHMLELKPKQKPTFHSLSKLSNSKNDKRTSQSENSLKKRIISLMD
jgi:hypothetical protein